MFKGYKVVVTGATSGIGLATAKLLLERGATVIGIGRNFDKAQDLGERFLPYKCDLLNPVEIEEACAFVDKTFDGSLDTLINCAGEMVRTSVFDVTPEQFHRGFDILLLAPMLMFKHLFPLLEKAESKNGTVINISSATNKHVQPFNTVFNLAKCALALYTKQLTLGCGGRNVRAVSVSPGVINTPMYERGGMTKAEVDKFFDECAKDGCGRIGEPEEVAELICFLASDAAPIMNSTEFTIDGALTTIKVW